MTSIGLAITAEAPWPVCLVEVVSATAVLVSTPAFKGMLRIGVMQTGQKEKDS